MADPKASFQEALKEYNFGERCHKLANLGKQLKGSPNLEATLDSFISTSADTKAAPLNAFEEKARLIVAKAAGCFGYAKKLLDHPSKTVCFSAAREGLLQAQDARAAFLSGDSSRKLKKFLLKCESLEADKEVLEHAWQLFGDKDKELFWPLLVRASSEELLDQYLDDGCPMRDWLSTHGNSEKIPGFAQLARRLPGFMVRMVRTGVLKWRWYWTKEILEKDPISVLHTTIVEGHEQGSGPKTGYVPGSKNQCFYETVVNWGWRKQPDMMLDLCSALMSSDGSISTGTYRSKGQGKGMVLMTGSTDTSDCIGRVKRLAEVLMDSTSTRNSITMNKKIALLMKIWSVVPERLKVCNTALVFASLMPGFAKEDHRGKEIDNLIAAFWQILGEVGRSERQRLLVGKEGSPPEKKFTECTTFLQKFSNKLPPPLAISQFFKILQEFDAGMAAFKFMQSNICRSSNGRHDELMQSVFKRYLQKEDEGPVKAAEMYLDLLKDARSRDVIQASLDMLIEHLDGHCELGLFQAVVQRMGKLEKESHAKETKHTTPDYKLPLPTGWLDLVELPKNPQPHTDFLLLVLHTGTGENNLLGVMVAKYGPIFFWEALDHILSAAQGKLMQPKAPSPVLQVLKDIDVKVIDEAASKASGRKDRAASSGGSKSYGSRIGNNILGSDGSVWGKVVADEGSCWKLDSGRIAKKVTEGDKWKWADGYSSSKEDGGACKYFEKATDMKKKANVKDVAQRLQGYTELMNMASKEKDASNAFEDLLPFLVSRFNAEQEQGRSHILDQLFSSKLLPEKLWEEKLEHLRSFWKLSSKTREKDSYQSTWNRLGKQLVQTALENWGKVEEGKEPPPDGPTEACLFGMEVAVDLNLPEILVGCHCKIKTLMALESTVRWVLENTVPLSGDVSAPLEVFWSALQTMGSIKFCGKDPNAVTSWKTLKDSVKVYKEKSSSSEELATKPAGSVQRGVQQGAWVELKDEPGYMLMVSERDGLPTMEQDPGKTAEKGLWETYPFIGEWWQKLLAQGVKQKGVDFVFTGILELLANRQSDYFPRNEKKQRWWAPIECAEYKSAVANVLANIESGEIPAKEGSAMLTRRIIALKNIEIMSTRHWQVRATKRRGRMEEKKKIEDSIGKPLNNSDFNLFPVQVWVQDQDWDIQNHKRFRPLPWQSYRCRDSVAELELKCFAKLLATSGIFKRDVLWQLAEVAAVLSGPQLLQIVEDAIAGLDPQFEGMARSISRHYPYLNTALTKGGNPKGSCDLLTPLLELCLLDDATRDASVSKIMKRDDFEYFLFFGVSFARHLTGARQEWLQQCLSKLKSPSESDVPLFYHYANRGPVLLHLARYGKAEPGWRDALSNHKGAIQMYLWHPDTQEAFLSKAITSTETQDLMLLPCCSFASGVAKVSDLLGLYPKEQSTNTTSADKWGFEVIQAAGAYNDIVSEVKRRFAEQPEPSFCDRVDDQEVETLLTALGRSDNAGAAMEVLGPHAGRVKQAKEAVTKMIGQLSPPQARVMIRKVMLPKKAGVGLQVAGLKKIVDLRIPEPLELYRFAWRKGACQRDVAANILAKVATSPEFVPDDVREFFGYFDQADKQDDQAYVADSLLTELIEQQEWVLPFLPKVVSKLSLLPGATNKAVQALQNCKTNVTDVVTALTEVMKAARLSMRAEPKNNKEGTEGRVLADLSSFMSFSSVSSLASTVATKQLDECDKSHLVAFVEELMRRWQDLLAAKDENSAKSLLSCTLTVWVKLLQPGNKDSWAATVKNMEDRLMRDGTDASLGVMCVALTNHAPCMGLGPDEWDALVEMLRQFFVRLLDGPFAVSQDAAKKTCPSDSEFNKTNERRATLRQDLLLNQWASLLSHGCSEKESEELFQRCPEMSKVQLAVNLVETWQKQAVEEKSAGQVSAFQQEKPSEGWAHQGGTPVSQIKPGAHVSGVITNSSNTFGVYVNFGCVKDGKLAVPTADWKKYRVGDRLENLMVNKVNVDKGFIDLLVVGSKGQTVGVEAAKIVAKRALKWISSSPLLRENNMDTLMTQWAKLVVEGAPEEFDASLELLGIPLPPKETVSVAEKLLAKKPDVALSRHVLQWLSKKNPAEAVRLWPQLLEQTKKDAKVVVLPEDMKSLLELCAAHNVELPKIPQVLAKALSPDVLDMLCNSELPEARLASVQALREQHRSGKPPKELKALCVDSCSIVRSAGRDLWSALGGKDEAWQKKKEVEEGEEEEDEDES
eukprot:TRINITY_DN102849_c0_g1_i1.p1 TRINITY_DN102849_c0_g1~~TRINITY_DN102849_c0_g1_i1.p1  ORF type:complete len:2224 (+),score=519.81 TRINITY_DN102849_c0_g1_i1:62-6733(+)